jgi:hypothetical protein
MNSSGVIDLELREDGAVIDDYGNLRPKVRHWLREHVGTRFQDSWHLLKEERGWCNYAIGTDGITCFYIAFNRPADAVLFKLTWGDGRDIADD